MRILLDQNLSPKLIRRLEDILPGLESVYDHDLTGASDPVIFEWARKLEFSALISADLDFVQIAERPQHVRLEIPEDLARQLAADPNVLTPAALEAVALEGVRSGKFTVSQARRRWLSALWTRWMAFKAHVVFLDLTLDDVRKDSEPALAFSR